MKDIINDRINRLRKLIAKENFDTFMVLVEENRRYLSGFTGGDSQFDETAGILFITETSLILATDSRYDEQAKIESPQYEIIQYKEGLVKELSTILGNLNTKKLGFESARLAVMQYDIIKEELKKAGSEIELVPVKELVEKLRVNKSEPEIESIKKATAIAETAFTECLKSITPGITEAETAWILEKNIREAGADALSFTPIIASGPNSAMPHAIPGKRKIKPGEPFLFDWGAKIDGYCSDTSRTVTLGKPDDHFEKIYQIVYDSQRMAIDAIKPGVSSKSIDKIARDHIDQKGYGKHFGHGLGHGTGLSVHEPPSLGPIKEYILEPGMISTVEPGIYIPGWGGVRLENMIVVRDDGAEVLNTLDLDHYIVEV